MKKLNGQQILLIIVFLININQVHAQTFFTENTTTGIPIDVYKFDIGDLENDGDLDMVISTYSKVNIYTNNGSGSFTLLSGTAFSSLTYEDGNPKFIDIDNDNDLDIVITSADFGSGTPTSQLYRNDGGSIFTQIGSFPAANMYATEIAVGDYNGDSHSDLIITGNQTSGQNKIYQPFINNGSGTFSTSLVDASIVYSVGNSSGQIVHLENLNNSGGDDLLIAFEDNEDLVYDLTSSTTLLDNLGSSNINQNAVVIDFDGDGDNDVIGNLGTTTHILSNNGSGSFTQTAQIPLSGRGTGVLAAADIDNDGDVDILRRGENATFNGYIGGLYINGGGANFYLYSGLTIPDILDGQCIFADMNGDNYPELIMANELASNGFKYYDNTYAANHSDKALDLDGTNHYTAAHDAALNTLPITIEFKVQAGGVSTTAGLMKKMTLNNGFQIGLIGNFMYAEYKTDASNYVLLNQVYGIHDGNWHHVAIVVESTGMKLYGNGVLQSSATWTGTTGAISDNSGLELGDWLLNIKKHGGNLDEVRIWNTARTTADIITNMCGKITNPANEANLVAYYDMNDYLIDNKVIFDQSSKYNHTTLGGGTLTVTTEQVGCTSPVLPVEFISFTGHLENDNVILNWITATEENNYGFEVERSLDGENWKKIGFIHGNGMTTEVSNYEFIDNETFKGNNYYRLKQIDFDEKYEYSNIIQLATGNSQPATVNIFPNPASDVLNIETNEPTFIQIINLNGQIIKEEQIDTFSKINIADIPAGFYFLKVGENIHKIIITRS